MNKHLHLHIGSPKTGTTAIQRFFNENRRRLNDQGVSYPGNEKNHHKLFFITKAPKPYWQREFRGWNEAELENRILRYLSLLEKDITTGCKTQFMSSEYFFFVDKLEYVRNAYEYLKKYYSSIDVYLFVRSPEEYFRSFEQTKLRARSYVESPTLFSYQFKNVAEAWGHFCDVHIIKYEPGLDSCRVLCDKIGVEYNDQSLGERPNSSISIEQMILLEKIQHNLYQNYNDILKGKIHLKIIPRINAPFTHRPQLQEWVKPVIYNKHSNDLLWLKEEHGIDFLNDESEKREFTSVPTFENAKATVRDVYKVPSEETVEKYEALVVDALLKKLVQNNQK